MESIEVETHVTHLSELDRYKLLYGDERMKLLGTQMVLQQTQLQQTQQEVRAHAESQKRLRAEMEIRYGVHDGDTIDLMTGEITRKKG